MNPADARKIEVFAPFSAALDLTKLILFQPFDLGKWFTIGFAAFLSHLSGGGGGAFQYNRKLSAGDWNWSMRSFSHDAFASSNTVPAWLWPVLAAVVFVVIVLVVALLWVGARGKFIFTDCLVRNRGAIAEPWREFAREGNSYFFFSLLLLFVLLVVFGLAAVPLWLPFVFGGNLPQGVGLIVGISLLGLVAIVTGLGVHLMTAFMIPVMYRRRCGASEGLSAAFTAVTAHPGEVLLYFLFSVVLWIAIALIGCLATCLTCCITAIPYLGTVILLPLYVFMMSYTLLFVRQFGNAYDAWANFLVAPPPAPPSQLDETNPSPT